MKASVKTIIKIKKLLISQIQFFTNDQNFLILLLYLSYPINPNHVIKFNTAYALFVKAAKAASFS